MRTSIRLDVIRGLAAFLVVLGHSRERLMYLQGLNMSPLQLIALGPTVFAQEAVAIFFVLSGYLVGGSVLRETRAGTFDWYTYFSKRISRLWVVLVPGLAVTAICDVLTRQVSAERHHIALEGSDDGLVSAVCNSLFLSPGQCRPYGTNASLWSLAYEFWFYVAFAAVAFVVVAARRSITAWILAAVVLSLAVVTLGPTVITYSVAWLMGVIVYEAVRRRPRCGAAGWAGVATLVALAATMAVTSYAHVDRPYQMVAVGAVTSVLLYLVVAGSLSSQDPHRSTRLMARMGPWSYSLYVFHLPIVTLVAALLPTDALRSSQLVPVGVVYLVAVLAAFGAWVLSLLSERHTGAVRGYLLRLRPVRPWTTSGAR